MSRLHYTLLALSFVSVLPATPGARHDDWKRWQTEQTTHAMASISGDDMLAHIKTLASDEFEGRGPGTRGEDLTVSFLIDQFKRAGLKPGNPDGTFVQDVPLRSTRSRATITLMSGRKGIPLKTPEDYVVRSRLAKKDVLLSGSKVAFVGFGIIATEYGWDDYKSVEVKGKVLLILDGEPKSKAGARLMGESQTRFGTRPYKIEVAAKKGAAGVLFIHEPDSAYATYKAIQNNYRQDAYDVEGAKGQKLLSVEGWITLDAVQRVFKTLGLDFDSMRQRALAKDFKALSLSLRANSHIVNELRTFHSRNVVGRIEGSDPRLKAEHVIFSAHWDHLGRDTSLTGDQIYNGAIDNAGGTSQLIEIAKAFASLTPAPRRSVLFICTTAEEKGYLGSKYYVTHPLYPIRNAIADINLDNCNMWGRTKDVNNLAYGYTTIDSVLEETARMQARTFLNEYFDDGSYFYLSDQIEFAKAGIPSVFPGSGSDYIGKPAGYGDQKWGDYGAHDYHQVTDEVRADWDMSGAVEDAQWLFLTGYQLLQSDEVPRWKPGTGFKRTGV